MGAESGKHSQWKYRENGIAKIVTLFAFAIGRLWHDAPVRIVHNNNLRKLL